MSLGNFPYLVDYYVSVVVDRPTCWVLRWDTLLANVVRLTRGKYNWQLLQGLFPRILSTTLVHLQRQTGCWVHPLINTVKSRGQSRKSVCKCVFSVLNFLTKRKTIETWNFVHALLENISPYSILNFFKKQDAVGWELASKNCHFSGIFARLLDCLIFKS